MEWNGSSLCIKLGVFRTELKTKVHISIITTVLRILAYPFSVSKTSLPDTHPKTSVPKMRFLAPDWQTLVSHLPAGAPLLEAEED